MMMNGNMNLYMLLNMIIMILIVGFIIYGVLLLILNFFYKKNQVKIESGREEDSSIKILKERFAKGEIDADEFENKYGLIRKYQDNATD